MVVPATVEMYYKRVYMESIKSTDTGEVIARIGLTDNQLSFGCKDTTQIRRLNSGVSIKNLGSEICLIEDEPYLNLVDDEMKIRSYNDSTIDLKGVYTLAHLTVNKKQIRVLLCHYPEGVERANEIGPKIIYGVAIVAGLLAILFAGH